MRTIYFISHPDVVINPLVPITHWPLSERGRARMVAALSQFQNKQSGYDAALKSYSMVQRMSLFQYLNV